LPKFRLTLEYDGRDFEGWQVQSDGRRTVQGALEAAVARVVGQPVRVVGASRTDAGVHAEGQVASFDAKTLLAPEVLARALNGVLPWDVAVVDLSEAPDHFHARRSARGKLYRYVIWNHPRRSPLRSDRSWHVARALDVGAMAQAAEVLRGTHDFTSFQAVGTPTRTTVRTLRRVDLAGEAPGELVLWVEGTAFLRHMVRILAGTLVDVGSGRLPPEALVSILAARNRQRAGRTAVARALTLMRVDY